MALIIHVTFDLIIKHKISPKYKFTIIHILVGRFNGHIMCKGGGHYPISLRCDGISHCPGGDDEQFCSKLAFTTDLLQTCYEIQFFRTIFIFI